MRACYLTRAAETVGHVYGRLTVLEIISSNGLSQARVACSCGNVTVMQLSRVRNGYVFSCGCLKRKNGQKHGLRHIPEYPVWVAMIARCERLTRKDYPNYGGRGIKVCEQWRKSFGDFIADMGRRPPGLTLERVDNDGPYCRENCVWATREQQGWNRQRTRMLTAGGVTKPVLQWAREIGMHKDTLLGRIENGWTPEKAISAPVGRSNKSQLQHNQ